MIDLIIQILKSWQVIAVTIVLILYIKLVTYVAQSYRRPRSAKKAKFKIRMKKAKPEPVTTGPEETAHGFDTNEELGLEEV